MATMYVIAGPNSSGKSTFFQQQQQIDPSHEIDLVNADHLYKEMKEKMPNVDTKEVWNKFSQQIDAHMKENKDFAVESTLMDDKTLSKMKEASVKGYHVDLSYISLNKVSDHFDRSGNTLTSKDTFDQEVKDSYKKLPEAMNIADTVKVYNNSKEQPELILEADREKVTYFKEKINIPEPIRAVLDTRDKGFIGPEQKPLSDLDVKIINPLGDPIAEIRSDFDDRNRAIKELVRNESRLEEKTAFNKALEKHPENQVDLKGQANEFKEKQGQELDKYVSQKGNVHKLDARLEHEDRMGSKERQQEQTKDQQLVRNMEKTEELSMAM
ncbi:MAG: hypothetical protein KJ737_12975 [Proteobacteria bacterium]|nr:hypothetical protein [Pseudomonadota bacterium]